MQTGNYFNTESGIDIHYVDKGQGQPIIFVPGWTFSCDVFENQVQYFSKSNRVIAVDPRCHGRSTMTMLGYDHTTHAKDLVKLINYLELKDIVLVGWSFGAYETWGMIREVGVSNIKGLLNIDMSPKALSTVEEDWVEGTIEEIADITLGIRSPEDMRNILSAYITEVMVQKKLSTDELNSILDMSKTPYYIASAQYGVACYANYIAEAQLADSKIPCAFVIAEHWQDAALPYMKKLCPNTELHVLGGHMMFWEYPDQFNQILENFIKECGR